MNKKPKKLASQGKAVEDLPLLQVRMPSHGACMGACAIQSTELSDTVSADRDTASPDILLQHMFVQALKDREEAVRNGKLTTIIFIRDKNTKAQEVSGYIDFGHRCV